VRYKAEAACNEERFLAFKVSKHPRFLNIREVNLLLKTELLPVPGSAKNVLKKSFVAARSSWVSSSMPNTWNAAWQQQQQQQ
jgi:hypothetical protein